MRVRVLGVPRAHLLSPITIWLIPLSITLMCSMGTPAGRLACMCRGAAECTTRAAECTWERRQRSAAARRGDRAAAHEISGGGISPPAPRHRRTHMPPHAHGSPRVTARLLHAVRPHPS